MLLGQSSPLRGDLGGGEMPAPDEVTAVVGGCKNWLRDEANGRYSRLSSACRSEPASFQVVYASLRCTTGGVKPGDDPGWGPR